MDKQLICCSEVGLPSLALRRKIDISDGGRVHDILQILQIYDRIDSKKEGAISRGDFRSFLEANPEFVALFLIAKPSLVSGSCNDAKWALADRNGGGKDL